MPRRTYVPERVSGALVAISVAAVSAASFEAMTRPTLLNGGSTHPYGFGLGLSSLDGHRRIGHGGGINGFRSQLSHYPDDDLTIAVLTNSGSARPGALESRIAQELFAR